MEEYINNEEHHDDHDKRGGARKPKLPANRWLFIAMVVYGVLALCIKIVCALAEKGTISTESLLPGLTILLITSALYFFLLQPYLRWYHIFRFWIESSIVTLTVVVMIGDSNPVAYDMSVSILGADFICIFIIWIPYIFASSFQKHY
ncbi:MAG TPA: hypothetical protein VK142_00035 [Bacillota bacterium]|nr:hypothetical protein [Bacillota bacterium]